ncbi:MAG: hypothetical protein NVS1B4_24950 [Gemmatimonadaceae bacterium]
MSKGKEAAESGIGSENESEAGGYLAHDVGASIVTDANDDKGSEIITPPFRDISASYTDSQSHREVRPRINAGEA